MFLKKSEGWSSAYSKSSSRLRKDRRCLPADNHSRKVDFAFSFEDLQSEDFLARAPTERGHFETLQTCLLQFPAAARLDMDLGGLHLGGSIFKSVLGEQWTQATSERSRNLLLEGPRQITELVLNRFRSHLIYLAFAVPLPSLTRLHVSLESLAGFGDPYYTDRFFETFYGLSDVAAIWKTLRKVQVCINLNLSFKEYDRGDVWDDQRDGRWNFWVRWITTPAAPDADYLSSKMP